jgi:translation initiation factor IF-3
LQNQTPINNFIKAKEVRVISEIGEQLGVMDIFSAIDLAKSKSLDLIQVTEKVDPPVCRIGDYGKYLYSMQKKEKKAKVKTKTELKEVRLGFNISPHDIETKAKQSEDFLKDGDKVKVSMVLKGREKAMGEYAKNKILLFLESVDKLTPIKIERELKREPRGFTLIISKQ